MPQFMQAPNQTLMGTGQNQVQINWPRDARDDGAICKKSGYNQKLRGTLNIDEQGNAERQQFIVSQQGWFKQAAKPKPNGLYYSRRPEVYTAEEMEPVTVPTHQQPNMYVHAEEPDQPPRQGAGYVTPITITTTGNVGIGNNVNRAN